MTDPITKGTKGSELPFASPIDGLEMYGWKGGKDYRSIVGAAGGLAAYDHVRMIELAQAAGMVAFATKALLVAYTTGDKPLALVTNDDVDPASNNGVWRWNAAIPGWVKSADRVTTLSDAVALLEAEVNARFSDLEGGGVTMTAAGAGAANVLPATPAGYRKVFIDGVAFAMPYYTFIGPLDLIGIVGQSNAQGHGDAALSPAAPNGVYIDNATGAISTPLADPVGGAVDGSMWPALANAWYALTGRQIAFVECATGSTALLAAADFGSGNWSPTGTLRSAAAADIRRAIDAINDSGTYLLGNVRLVWAQGEQEAENMDGVTFTGEDYRAALADLATYFKAQIPEMVEMCVIQSARNGVTAGDPEWWAAIRKAQEDACNDSALLRMACTAAMSMTYRVPQWMEDGVHYDQKALNQIGSMAAYEILSPDAAAFAPAPFVTTSNYSGAGVASRTIAGHACQAGTHSLVLAVGIGKTGSSTGSVDSVTFGGKAARLVQKAGSGSGTLPASAAQASIWILDEDDFGASLSAATGDIVVTLNGATGIIVSVSIIESEEHLVIESQDWENDSSGAVVDIDTANYCNSPALLVSCVAGRIDSAIPPTFAFNSGAEATDYGYNLDTRSYAAAVAYEVLASAQYPKTITATPSATMVHAGLVSACFRRRFAGETDVA